MLKLALAITLSLIAIPALAQTSPTESEVLQARAAAAEAQVRYLAMLLRAAQVQDDNTKEWWAKVWDALVAHDHPSK